jgi:hypothetical protein
MRRLAGRPKFTIGALGIFFALAIAFLFLADLRARYRAEIDHASHSAQNYADVLAQHTALTFEAIDRSLREVELIRADLETALPCREPIPRHCTIVPTRHSARYRRAR